MATGEPVVRKKLYRGQFLKFPSEQPSCVVAMEACAASHCWGCEIMKLGHDLRLIPPIYVKPFVKPRMLVAIALANKTARTIWAMMTKHEDYRDLIAAV